jgi:hypothetical protein
LVRSAQSSYFLAAAFGAILFTGYWCFLGRILPAKVNADGSRQSDAKKPDIQQTSEGSNSPNIIGNGNTVTINPTPPPQPAFKE